MLSLVSSFGVQTSRNGKFYIYVISKNDIKVFFTGESWSEDINEKVETDDIKFAIDSLSEILSDNVLMNKLKEIIAPF